MARTRQPGRTRRRLASLLDPSAEGPVADGSEPQPGEYGAADSAVDDGSPWPGVLEQFSRRILPAVYEAVGHLDAIEDEEQDPDRLDKLYRIDHAVTRIRRQAENMQVLAGRQVQDFDRQVTSLLDVVRAAASAVEQYPRVHVSRVVELAVVEFAADDVMRVLTELLDNATRYSPPSSQVIVSAHLTEQGSVLIRVEDEGQGIRPDELAWWNAVLAGTAALPADRTSQLGLTIAAQLAASRRMRVQLVPHQAGGTTATVLVPTGLVCEMLDADTSAYQPDTARPPAPVADMPTGRPLPDAVPYTPPRQDPAPENRGLQDPWLQEPALQDPWLQEPGPQDPRLQSPGPQSPGPQGGAPRRPTPGVPTGAFPADALLPMDAAPVDDDSSADDIMVADAKPPAYADVPLREPRRWEPVQPDPVQPEPVQPEPVQREPERWEPAHREPAHRDPAEREPGTGGGASASDPVEEDELGPLPMRTPSSVRSDDTMAIPVVTAGSEPPADRLPWYEDVAAFAAGVAEANQPNDRGQEG